MKEMSEDKVMSTISVDRFTPARVMILRQSNNTFKYTYDGFVITSKFINNNRKEINEIGTFRVGGHTTVLDIDYTLIRK